MLRSVLIRGGGHSHLITGIITIRWWLALNWDMKVCTLSYSHTINHDYASLVSEYTVRGWGISHRHSKTYRCTGTESRLSKCFNYTDTSLRTERRDVLLYCSHGKTAVCVYIMIASVDAI